MSLIGYLIMGMVIVLNLFLLSWISNGAPLPGKDPWVQRAFFEDEEYDIINTEEEMWQ